MTRKQKTALLFAGGVLLALCAGWLVCMHGFQNREAKQAAADIPPIAEEPVAETAVPVDYGALVAAELQNAGQTVHYGVCVYDANYAFETDSGAVPSASVIKLFIMEYAFLNAVPMDTDVGGTQLIQLIKSMITRSDNNATNALIDYFTMDALNAYFAEQGYADTRLERKMLDSAAVQAGKDNYTSVHDVMCFLSKLYAHKEEAPYREMLDIMKNQQVATKIRRDLPFGTVIANKTGELASVQNDVGIVFTEKGDFQLVCLVSGVQNTARAQNAIAGAALTLYNAVMAQ